MTTINIGGLDPGTVALAAALALSALAVMHHVQWVSVGAGVAWLVLAFWGFAETHGSIGWILGWLGIGLGIAFIVTAMQTYQRIRREKEAAEEEAQAAAGKDDNMMTRLDLAREERRKRRDARNAF